MNSVTFVLGLKSEEEVIRFFRVNKTQISCMDEPNTFLNQLRDHGLVEEEVYKKVTKMRNRERRQGGVYEILNWIETQGGQCVKTFWGCVFQDHILNKYPVLRTLQTSLLDGSVFTPENLFNAEILTGSENYETGQNAKGTKRKNITDESGEEGEGSSASSQKKLATFSKFTDSHHESLSTPYFNNPLDQVKVDACCICNEEEEGVLINCRQCRKAFHRECHLPVVQDQTARNSWVCTFCVAKTNQVAQIPLKREDVLDCPVSDKIMHCQYLLLYLYKEDNLHVFTDNPSTTDAEWNSESAKAMWLNKVKSRLQENIYKTVGEFVNDIQLIFSNCQALNSDNDFGLMAAKLKKMFEREFQSIFKIK
ncbi:uncharacterized protein Hap1MRO34_002729 [Clarias gariepinus]